MLGRRGRERSERVRVFPFFALLELFFPQKSYFSFLPLLYTTFLITDGHWSNVRSRLPK